MLLAKLFAALGIVLATCVFLRLPSGTPVDIHLQATYLVVTSGFLLRFCALASAFAAVIYYAGSRWLQVEWNQTLGIVHFSFFLIAIVLVLGAARWTTAAVDQQSEAVLRSLIPGVVGMCFFLLSGLVFAVNLIWTTIRFLHTR